MVGRVVVMLPAWNEEKTIGMTIDDIPKGIDILVIDNNSSDSTRDIAINHGATVIFEGKQGKGNAIIRAIDYIKGIDCKYVVMLDADYTYPGQYIPNIINLLANGNDVVIGSRLTGIVEKGAMSRLNIFGNFMLTLMAKILYGYRISDLCTGMWGFSRECLTSLNITEHGFGLEANIFVQIAKRKYKLAEIPIYYRKRPTKAKLKSLEDGFKIGLVLLKQRFTGE